MALLRHHNDDDDNPGPSHYRMREKMFAIGDDYWIENGNGDHVFKVNGKAFRVRDTFILEDPSGRELLKSHEKKLTIRDKMEIERDGKTFATVKKAIVAPFREHFEIEVHDGKDIDARGNVVDHEYKIERDGDTIAEVSKRWFRIRDTYGIKIAPEQDVPLLLAITVCLDRMHHD